jgi:hypothetical protein
MSEGGGLARLRVRQEDPRISWAVEGGMRRGRRVRRVG